MINLGERNNVVQIIAYELLGKEIWVVADVGNGGDDSVAGPFLGEHLLDLVFGYFEANEYLREDATLIVV